MKNFELHDLGFVEDDFSNSDEASSTPKSPRQRVFAMMDDPEVNIRGEMLGV